MISFHFMIDNEFIVSQETIQAILVFLLYNKKENKFYLY